MIHLEKIDKNNVWDVLELKVAESQADFIATNEESIIEAYVATIAGTSAFPFGIYDDNKPVGFLMVGFNTNAYYDEDDGLEMADDNYVFWRFMIDEKYQRQGYGREAVKLALEFIRTWPCGKAEYCVTSYEAKNEVAKMLYLSLGFEEIGKQVDGEDIAVLKL